MPSVSVTYTIGVSRHGRLTIVFGYLVGFYDSKIKFTGWFTYTLIHREILIKSLLDGAGLRNRSLEVLPLDGKAVNASVL